MLSLSTKKVWHSFSFSNQGKCCTWNTNLQALSLAGTIWRKLLEGANIARKSCMWRRQWHMSYKEACMQCACLHTRVRMVVTISPPLVLWLDWVALERRWSRGKCSCVCSFTYARTLRIFTYVCPSYYSVSYPPLRSELVFLEVESAVWE